MGGSEAEYCDLNVFLVKACVEKVIFHIRRQSSRREVRNGLCSLMQILVSYHSPSRAFGDDTGEGLCYMLDAQHNLEVTR